MSPGRVESLRKAWQIDDLQAPVVVLPGRLTQWKGQEVFIDSLALLGDIPFIALCVGDTEENQAYTRKLLDKIRDAGLDGKIRLVGHCSDMPAAMLLAGLTKEADALLLGVNIGGLGTMIASMASVISYKLYAAEHPSQAGKYVRTFLYYNFLGLLLIGGAVYFLL